MQYMLCRNRVENFTHWKTIFDSELEAQHDSGLQLEKIWQDANDPNNVFFIFKITDLAKAQAFVTAPESAETGRRAGVVDGDIHYVNEI